MRFQFYILTCRFLFEGEPLSSNVHLSHDLTSAVEGVPQVAISRQVLEKGISISDFAVMSTACHSKCLLIVIIIIIIIIIMNHLFLCSSTSAAAYQVWWAVCQQCPRGKSGCCDIERSFCRDVVSFATGWKDQAICYFSQRLVLCITNFRNYFTF